MGRFEAIYATISGRDADGAATVCAVGDGNQASTDCVGRAARRTSRIVMRIVWVERSAVGGIVVGGV